MQPGDAVQTGDTLISGLVPPTQEGGGYRLTHAHGAVQAHTRHTVQTARALDASRKQYTGRVRRQYALTLGNKRLNLYIGSGITGATCDKIVETRTWRLSDSVVFPVSLVVQTYVYYEPAPAEQTVETVRADMISRALGDIAAAMDGTVTAHSETLTGEGGRGRAAPVGARGRADRRGGAGRQRAPAARRGGASRAADSPAITGRQAGAQCAPLRIVPYDRAQGRPSAARFHSK